jgi:hypothetical protein
LTAGRRPLDQGPVLIYRASERVAPRLSGSSPTRENHGKGYVIRLTVQIGVGFAILNSRDGWEEGYS